MQCLLGVCYDPCTSGCGESALCHVNKHIILCSCPPKYSGDPLVKCIPLEKTQKPKEYKDIPIDHSQTEKPSIDMEIESLETTSKLSYDLTNEQTTVISEMFTTSKPTDIESTVTEKEPMTTQKFKEIETTTEPYESTISTSPIVKTIVPEKETTRIETTTAPHESQKFLLLIHQFLQKVSSNNNCALKRQLKHN